VVTRYFPTNPQEIVTIATAAIETNTKAVSEDNSGMARVIAADRTGDTLTSLDFGRVDVGQSLDNALTVHNIGTGDLAVTSLTSNNESFSVVPPPVCSPDCFTVAPGGQHSVTVRFRPPAPGEQLGRLTIASNDPDESPRTIDLKGVGEGVPDIEVALDPLDFGRVDVGQHLDKALTVRNTGTGDLRGDPITSTNPLFSVVSPTGAFTLTPKGERGVTVRFSPTAPGAQSGVLSIASNDPDPDERTRTIDLLGVGQGVPNIRVVPPDVFNFGGVDVGRSATIVLRVTNDGTADLNVSITSPTPPFSVVSPTGPFTVPPRGEQPFTVRFSPATVGFQSIVLRIASNDPDTMTVPIELQGTGVDCTDRCIRNRMECLKTAKTLAQIQLCNEISDQCHQGCGQ
jgi:hypothetical protein